METVSTNVLPRFILFWNMKKKIRSWNSKPFIEASTDGMLVSLELVKYSQANINTSPLATQSLHPFSPDVVTTNVQSWISSVKTRPKGLEGVNRETGIRGCPVCLLLASNKCYAKLELMGSWIKIVREIFVQHSQSHCAQRGDDAGRSVIIALLWALWLAWAVNPSFGSLFGF